MIAVVTMTCTLIHDGSRHNDEDGKSFDDYDDAYDD